MNSMLQFGVLGANSEKWSVCVDISFHIYEKPFLWLPEFSKTCVSLLGLMSSKLINGPPRSEIEESVC